MIGTILVPLDGSPLAERALPYAMALAQSANARLTLMRAIVSESYQMVGPGEAKTATERAQSQLAAIAGKVRGQGLRVSQLTYRDELPARAIAKAAEEAQADLVVMSTHGWSGFGRWAYGSVADDFLRSAERPVLLVPALSDFAWPTASAADGRRVVVPLDGSDFAEEALTPAANLAELLSAELLLVRVVEPVQLSFVMEEGCVYVDPDLAAEVDGARRYLDGVAERLRADGRSVQTRATSGSPGAVIAEAARGEGVVAVAMATHGRGGPAKLAAGSIASVTLHRTASPVLLVRPAALRPRRVPVGLVAREQMP